MTNEIYTHMGACPFCGQMQQVELPIETPTVEELEAAALMQCRCPAAKKERERERKLRDANMILDGMFPGDEHHDLRALLYDCVKLLLCAEISGATIAMGFRRTVKIREKNGNVRITICAREEESEEIT